jgi:hypothetical protein
VADFLILIGINEFVKLSLRRPWINSVEILSSNGVYAA